MKAVILQPSYIPWRGYFDQIKKADVFVFYDDVQYDGHGWRNRNQIKTSQGKQWLTIPVHSHGDRQGDPINQVSIDWGKPWAKSHWKAITYAYGRAPFFRQYAAFVETFYQRRDDFLADFTIAFTIALARALGIDRTRFMRSSDMSISGQKTERLITILAALGADHYISGPSARDYLEESRFEAAGIRLEYMVYNYPQYPQLYPPFEPNVSILDLLFMTGPQAARYLSADEG
jgi:hypothetical protein